MIYENVKELLGELPPGVELVAAAKGRTPQEILQAIEAGVKIVGQNYVQEAQNASQALGERARWHFIGYLQKNKTKKAVRIFDMIETVDSFGLASDIDKECEKINKIMPVLIEVNSGQEQQKAGVMPGEAISLIEKMAGLKNIKIEGLMTMGPALEDPQGLRPYFRNTKELFINIKQLNIPGVEMRYLSMGMSNSYKVAIEEGANMVRIGTRIFGERL